MQEILETLGEISGGLDALGSAVNDKKTVSDVMLALEKIHPVLNESFTHPVARLCDTLGKLFEKFLMESVDDPTPGLALTGDGVGVIGSAVKGGGDLADHEKRADDITGEIAKLYEIETDLVIVSSDEQPTVDVPPAQNEMSEDPETGDDPFAMMGEAFAQKEASPPEEDMANEKPCNPIADKLSSVAAEITSLEPDLMDKKAVADVMLGFEKLADDLKQAHAPAPIINLSLALGGLYEKSMMEGLADGQKALDFTMDGTGILSAHIDGGITSDDLINRTTELIKAIGSEFEIDVVIAPPEGATDVVPEEAEQVDESGSVAPEAETSVESFDAVPIATSDDLLLYTEFYSETVDTIHSLESDLLELESDPTNYDLINNLFRGFHSLKGAAGFLGASTMNLVCHEAETLLDKLRKKVFVCDQTMIDVFLRSVDVINVINDGLSAGAEEVKASLPDATLKIPRLNVGDLVGVLATLAENGPTGAGSDESPERLGDILMANNAITKGQLDSALNAQKPIGQILVEMGAVDEKAVGNALQVQTEKKKKAQAASLKVDTEKLDGLLELVGELVISQSIVLQDSALSEDVNKNLVKSILNLGKITRNIQDHVMSLRMVPLRQTFQKMSRLVRDLSKKMGKQVNFVSVGEDTEIDKTLIEELNDPLVHLLRNAMDHGLETPEERQASGKSAEGTVTLSAYHSGGNVHIEVSDDGKGLNRERVLEKAIDKGLVEEGAKLSDDEIHTLIFMPGFSTHDVATDISGRGVGMDVVRSNIEKLGGRVDITGKPGQGSTFTIKLPLTMAIVDGMIVKIGENRFVIPTVSIRESIRPKKGEISTVHNEGEVINVRGSLMPLVRLFELLKVNDAKCHNPYEGLVIIVESENRAYGFMVDDLIGQQQVVIKSLGKRFKGLAGVSGGTILGDGRVGLILDVTGVVGMN